MALEKLLPATSADQLAKHDVPFILRVFEVAVQVKSEKLASPPRAALLDALWSERTEKIITLTLLGLGKRTGDKAIIGAAYYSILRYGQPWWSSSDALDAADQKRLNYGMMHCAQHAYMYNCIWLADGIGCCQDCSRKHDVLAKSAETQIQCGVKF